MDRIKKTIQDSIDVKRQILNSDIPATLKDMSEQITSRLKGGNTLFLCGNGGSAADAQHIAAELSVRFERDRQSLPAIALGTNISHTTAAGNDFGFSHIFSRQLEGIGQANDMLIAISTSGNSDNVLRAIQVARKKEMLIIGWTGMTGGEMAGLTDILIRIPSDNTARIQESHILCGHILCQLIDDAWTKAK